MNDNTYNILLMILKDFVFFTAFALFLISLVIGLLLLLRPSLIIQLNEQVSKKFSLRRATRLLEVPNKIDHMFYRHHRILGIIVTLTSVYVLYYFIAVYDAVLITDYIKNEGYATSYDIVISAIRIFMVISSAFILLLGLAIIIRPSQIKTLERWANRWISTRQSARPLSIEHDRFNQLVYNYPRLTGLIITSLSLYAFIFLFFVYTQ